MNFTSRLDLFADLHPEKPALIFLSSQKKHWEAFTYKQLTDLTNRLARGLQSCGIKAGDRALLMAPPSVEFFALAIALLKTRILPVMIDPAIGLANLTKCIAETKPDVFIGNSLTHALRILYGWGKGSFKKNITIGQLLRTVGHGPFEPPQISADTPAAVIFTSGSTGAPKGVVYTHGNFAAQLDMLAQTFGLTKNEIDLPAFPLFALIDCLLGVTAIVPDMRFPAPAKVDPKRVIAAVNKFNVNNMFASPIVLDRMAAYGVKRGIKLPSLKRVITAGAPAPVQVLEEFRRLLPDDAGLYGIYGATESLPNTVIDSKEILNETRYKSALGAGVCIGRPVKGVEVRVIRIIDEPIPVWHDSLEVGPNTIGEITVKGPAVTRSYFGEETNQNAKIEEGNEIVHRMGDLGYFDEQGRLWFCGRKSHRVITNDEILFTEQIEGVFNAYPSVYRTALVGVNNKPVLWVELEKHALSADKERIKLELAELSKFHPHASKIKTFLFMKKFPTDVRHNSKIIREKLTSLAQEMIP